MSIYSETFNIEYHLIAADLTARFPGLMFCVQEASIRHTESTDYKMQWYTDNMRGWILTNWHIEVSRMPKWNEVITVRTWPSRFKGIVADRSFEVLDAEGNRLVSAVAAWVYMDLAQRRPVKPPQDLVDGYGEVLPPIHETVFAIGGHEGYNLVSTREMTVTRRDTDTNEHANNVRYIEWAFDDIPEAIYASGCPATVKVAYKRECKAGDKLFLDCFVRAGLGADAEVIISIRKNGEDAPVCEVYTTWITEAAT